VHSDCQCEIPATDPLVQARACVEGSENAELEVRNLRMSHSVVVPCVARDGRDPVSKDLGDPEGYL
jgi:hypothetical protein